MHVRTYVREFQNLVYGLCYLWFCNVEHRVLCTLLSSNSALRPGLCVCVLCVFVDEAGMVAVLLGRRH